MADLEEAVRQNPGSRSALNARGRGRMQAGRYAEAIADFDTIIRDNSNDAVGYNSRCDALALAGRLQEALSDCNKALSIRPDYVAAFDSRGVVYLHLSQYQSAIRASAALRLAPRFALSLYGRGVAEIKSGDATGNADIDEAIKIEPRVEARMASYGVTP